MSVVRSALLLVAIACAGAAQAATYVVDTTSADAGVSGCDDATANDCALAGAIAKANASGGVVDTIHFNIPTGDPGCHAAQGWCVIAGSGDLTVNEALTIDGFTQPGAAANTIAANVGGLNAVHKIQINPGLRFTAPGLVRGLVLNGRGNNQVWPLLYANPNLTTDEFRVEGNAFGEALDGGASMVTWALVIQSRSPVRVGGLQAAARNLFCKAGAALVNHTNSGKLRVYGNLFGVNAERQQHERLRRRRSHRRQLPVLRRRLHLLRLERPERPQRRRAQGPRHHAEEHEPSTFSRWRRWSCAAITSDSAPTASRRSRSNTPTSPRTSSALMFGGDQPGDGNIVVGPASGNFAAVDTGSNSRGAVFGNHFVDTHLKPWYLRYSDRRRSADAPSERCRRRRRQPRRARRRVQNHPEITAFALEPTACTSAIASMPASANAQYPLQVEFYSAITQAPRDRFGSDVYEAADAQSIKQRRAAAAARRLAGERCGDRVRHSASMPPAPSSRASSEIGWHPVTLGFAPGTSAATIDHVANTVSVDVATPAPFVPRGTVRIAYTWSSFTYQYCDAMLVATGPSSARATCTLAAGNPGLHVLRAVMTSNDVPFADAATGGNPNVWMDHAVVANDLFKDSFE
jgi:hypothetical protein